jgi:putative sterol carrier protein
LTEDESARNPEFRVAGNVKQWRRVISREVDPIKALMTNTLKLKGNFAKIMRSVRAAQELVLCAAAVPTAFE